MRFTGLDEISWGWVYNRIAPSLTRNTRGVVAWSKGEIVAATVFDSWLPNSGHAHIVIEKPMVIRHGFLEECFNYFFNACEKGILYVVVPSFNDKSLNFVEKLGFELLYISEKGFSTLADLHVFEMRKENCRYIEHEQARTSRAA